jgi:hypothetical protein
MVLPIVTTENFDDRAVLMLSRWWTLSNTLRSVIILPLDISITNELR